LRKNLTMYSGIQLTDVITNTFQQKCHDQRNTGSESAHDIIRLCLLLYNNNLMQKGKV